jgi:hypothetical protein
VNPGLSQKNQARLSAILPRPSGAWLLSSLTREQEIVHRIFWLGETQASAARSLGVSRMAISKTVKKITKLGRAQIADLYDCALVHWEGARASRRQPQDVRSGRCRMFRRCPVTELLNCIYLIAASYVLACTAQCGAKAQLSH